MAEGPVVDPVLFALVEPLRKLSSRLFAERSAGGITLTRCDQGVDVLIGPVTADGLGALEAMTDFAVKHGLARLSVDRRSEERRGGTGCVSKCRSRWAPDH